MLFEIKSRWDGKVLFSLECGSLKLCVEAAVKSRVNLHSADLRSANLHSADLRSANLSFANLSFANLSSADLHSANLHSADLRSANLSFANLRFANLSSADLRSANLHFANGVNKHRVTPLLILLDQPGPIRAYKLVQGDGGSPMSSHQGYSRIYYVTGADHHVDNACCDEMKQCAAGINLATLDWCMREWIPGWRILVAEFTASDIAAIPTATDGKFRVHRCRIVGEKDLVEIGLIDAPQEGKE